MSDYLPVLILVLILAAFLREDSVLIIFYLLGGIYLVGTWWSKSALNAVRYDRIFSNRAFLHETLKIRVRLHNTGWLPVTWLQLHESLPVELGSAKGYRSALSIPSYGNSEFTYQIYAQKRGYYRIGPLFMRSGDMLGLSQDEEVSGKQDYLVVYPRIIPITHMHIPSCMAFGTIRHALPIFEDPSRVFGKRGYQPGDSQRRIDWKSSAVTGALQVKQFAPSIALESTIFLNLNAPEYESRSRRGTTEMGIVVAASLANWMIGQKQSVGLWTNGLDPLETNHIARPISPSKGRGHLMHILDLLARVETSSDCPYLDLVHQQVPHLAWGTTVILLTGQAPDALFDSIFSMRRKGLIPFLVLLSPGGDTQLIEQRAEHFGVPFHVLRREDDIENWW